MGRGVPFIAGLSLITILLMAARCYGQAVENLAPLATVHGSGTNLPAAVDGIKQEDGNGEWIGGSPKAWYGWIRYPKLELLRLTIPRRVYTRTHMDYVAAALQNVYGRRDKITSGYKIRYEAPIMRHFTVELEKIRKK